MKKVILFLVLSLTLAAVISLAGCGGSPSTPPLTYTVGDTGPAGGLIFYDKGSYSDGWRYMEATPSDQSTGTGMQWYNGTYVVTGATGTTIGTGQANTTAIVIIQGAGNYAAQLCNDLIVSGFNDWFLPSKDELNQMYVNLHLQGVGGFAGYSSYWSSSEWSSSEYAAGGNAWAQYFYDGDQFGVDKDSYYGRVRAVRYF